MRIILDKQEEEAVQKYADKHKLTYGEAFQKMLDAMTKGLLELAKEDNELGMGEQSNKVSL